LLLLGLLALPIIEITLFIVVGGEIGVLPTLLLVILSAVVGAMVVRRQGIRTLDKLQASLDTGGDPSGPLAHGALILFAGVLLMLPGFFTDAIGILLLIPPVRAQLIRRGASRVTVRASTYVRPRRAGPSGPVETIEADYEVVDDGTRRQGNSGWTRHQ
jgi:UPF0716 protein FxsA